MVTFKKDRRPDVSVRCSRIRGSALDTTEVLTANSLSSFTIPVLVSRFKSNNEPRTYDTRQSLESFDTQNHPQNDSSKQVRSHQSFHPVLTVESTESAIDYIKISQRIIMLTSLGSSSLPKGLIDDSCPPFFRSQ